MINILKQTFLIPLVLAVAMLQAQEIEVPSYGTDSTLEVLSWNLEWFPKNDQTTIDYVSQIIDQLDIDIYAFQEISDTVMFKQMLNNHPGYKAYLKSDWYGGLVYLYKSDVITIDTAYEIYTTSSYWRPFPRSPLVLEVYFMFERFILINNHLKCCGDGELDPYDPWDEETRRLDACDLLHDYINQNFQTEKVILLGDLNDDLTDNNQDNVFRSFLDFPGQYRFTDIEIAEGPEYNWSYPTWPSHLDHILITNELFDEFERSGSGINTLKIDQYMQGGWNEYEEHISDHRPVVVKLNTDASLNIEEDFQKDLSFYPNPCNKYITIQLKGNKNYRAIITDITGNIVKEILINPGNTPINVELLPAGLYFIYCPDLYEDSIIKFIKSS